MRSRASAVLLLLTLAVLTARAQQPSQQPSPLDTPIFRSTVDAIELDAFVVDAAGNPVTDLTADDFEIIADGVAQEITAFAAVNIPIERTEQVTRPSVPTDVRTNERPEGRIYLFAVDEVPASMVPRLRLRLRQFVEQHFGENDSAAIVYVGRGKSSDGQDFTSDRAILIRAIDRLSGGYGGGDLEAVARPVTRPGGNPATALSATEAGAAGAIVGTATAVEAAQIVAANGSSYLLERESEFLLRSRMLSLRTLTEYMASLRGRRKSIIYVTTGLGTSVYEALDYEGGVRSIAIEDLHAAITAATRGDVSIYPMDPGGLVPGRDITEVAAPNPDNSVPEASLTAIGRMQDLRSLAETTGGFAIVNTNNYEDAFTRVVRENSSYYVLGFSTSTPHTDGRFHSVEIRVKRPGLQVRSRGGYLAPLRRKVPIITRASTLAPAIVDALRSPIAVPGVPIRVFAAPYKGAGQQARVAIAAEFGVDALNLVEQQGRFVGDLAVALRPTSEDGKLLAGQRHEMKLALKPETFQTTRTRGVRVLTEMALPPGRYQLRVAGGPNTGHAGSVTYDLDIPSYGKDQFSMSGVALTSSAAQGTVTIWPGTARPLDKQLPSPITAARDFWSEETVTLYTEVYENGRRQPHTIDFKAELKSASGRVLSTFTAQRPSDSSGTYGFTVPIRLADVDPGAYVLRVAATSSIGSKPTVSKEIPIRVR